MRWIGGVSAAKTKEIRCLSALEATETAAQVPMGEAEEDEEAGIHRLGSAFLRSEDTQAARSRLKVI